MRPIHKIKIVEPLYMPDLLKQAIKNNDVEKSFVTEIILTKKTVELIHELIQRQFFEIDNFDHLINLMEASADLGFKEQVSEFIEYFKEHREDEYYNYIAAGKADNSSADGSDNR